MEILVQTKNSSTNEATIHSITSLQKVTKTSVRKILLPAQAGVISLIFLFLVSFVQAADRYLITASDWNPINICALTSDGAEGTSVQVATGNVFIKGGYTDTYTAFKTHAVVTGNNFNTINVNTVVAYRSKVSGKWENPGTWEVLTGGAWIDASTTPTSDDGAITILSGHKVTVNADVTVDEVTVETGGTLENNVNPNFGSLHITTGAGTDLLVKGTLISRYNIDNYGSILFAAGSLYQHIRSYGGKSPADFSEIPIATWDVNSTCEILSVSGNPVGGLNQFFGNFTWNFSGQFIDINLAGELTIVNGNFTVANTGGFELQLASTQNTLLQVGGNLSITSGKLMLPTSGKITVRGITKLGQAECLILKSDASGTASFIDNGTILGPGTARIECYLDKFDIVSNYKFHFLSSPVGDDQTIQPEFSDPPNIVLTEFYKWDEPANGWINFRGTTTTSVNTTFGDNLNFVAGKGYLVAYPDNVIKNFVGKPFTSGPLPLEVTCTKVAGGWNLLGNPFPSAIDWDYLVNRMDIGIDNALYYYDNSLANYRYYIPLTGGTGGASRYIPAMQGFMVHASSNTNNTIIIDNGARIHSGQTAWYRSAVSASNILNLSVEGNNYADHARICFYDSATINFDRNYDAYKLFSYNASVPQLYSLTPDNTKVAINTLPLSTMYGDVPLGFTVGAPAKYTITADGIGSFPASMSIKLEDKKTRTSQKLNVNPVYSFAADIDDQPNRFVLHFQEATSVDEPEKPDDFSVLADNGVINVITFKAVSGQVNIIDMAGRKIGMAKLVSGTPARIDMQGSFGVYIVNIVTGQGVVNKKVVIR